MTGLIFAPSGDNLYSSSSNGSLALYDTHYGGDSVECRVVRVIGNTAAKGEKYGPRALTLSEDGSRLAFIGPMEFTVTVLDAHTMEEVTLGRGYWYYVLVLAIFQRYQYLEQIAGIVAT